MSWRNSEGYSDPTAGQALANIMREERMKKRRYGCGRLSGTGERHRYAGRKRLEDGGPDFEETPQARKGENAEG